VETPLGGFTAAKTAMSGFTQWPRDIAERKPQTESLHH
jgi:hypothetical protein